MIVFDNNGLMWPYGLIFSEYCNFFIFCYVNKVLQIRILIFLINFIGEFEDI
jgi:hypothetical protein